MPAQNHQTPFGRYIHIRSHSIHRLEKAVLLVLLNRQTSYQDSTRNKKGHQQKWCTVLKNMFGAKALTRTLRCKRLSIGTERYTEMLDNISQTIQNFWIILEKLIQQ